MSNTIAGSVKEVYEHRYLLYSMVVRNLKGKYKSSHLGFAWHFVTPAITIVIFYVVFTGIRAAPVDDYWVYLSIGMFPFTFLQTNLSQGSNCVVSNAGTINKIYFPREIVAFAQVISTFIIFIMAYAVIIILMLLTGFHIGIQALVSLPLILLLSVIFATGYVLLLSAITVFVRDVHHFIEAIARVLFWITPIFYLANDTTGILERIIWYNPFTYFIVSYQDILYLGDIPDMFQLGVCCILSVAVLLVGLLVFNKLKGKFAEEL